MSSLRIVTPVADLRKESDGGLGTQLVFGEDFEVEKTENGQCYGRTECGYRGWVSSAALGAKTEPTSHRVSAMGSFIYAAPDMKSATVLRLPYGAQVCVYGTEAGFSRTEGGYVYSRHLAQQIATDFVAEAERFIGAPYLWGGRSSNGLDCSALVQVSLKACGIGSPRDSHMQEDEFRVVSRENGELKRGDLVFWKGHVGIMQDRGTLLHANAYHMAVASEPLDGACKRIEASGDGVITAIKRPG